MVSRIAFEVVAGVAVGGFIGWLLDGWLGTAPVFMLILFCLGAFSGIMSVWRMAKGKGLKMGYFDQHRNDKD